jgi:glycosyltransferase involved in cell wall biosynthesis
MVSTSQDVRDQVVRQAVIIGFPWPRSGSGQVFSRQIRDLRELGFRTVFAAIASHYDGGFNDAAWDEFRLHSHELGADEVVECRFEDLNKIRRAAEMLKALAMRLNAMHWALAPAQFTEVNARLAAILAEGETPLILANHVYTMPFALKVRQQLEKQGQSPRLLACTHDVQSHVLIDREAKAPWKRAMEHEGLLVSTEVEWLSAADALIHASEADRDFLAPHLRKKPHYLILPAIDAIEPSRALLKSRALIYVGGPHPGNIASLAWYFDEVVPNYQKPPALALVGRISEARDKFLKMPRPAWLEITGPVPDLARYYQSAKLAICPTTQGRGISIKTIEAFAAGLPVVGTSLAYRGMPRKELEAEGVKPFDNAAEFAGEIERMMFAPNLREESQRSLKLYHKLFTPAHSLAILRTMLSDLGVPTG